MNPRDMISPLHELLVKDNWANVSVSSLDISDSEDDDSCCSDDDEVGDSVMPRLSMPILTHSYSNRHNTTQQTMERLQRVSSAVRMGGTSTTKLQQQKKQRSTPAKMRLARSLDHSCSTNELLTSPMRKFKTQISDSNLNTSRSSRQAARLRSVTQANAKWDATGLKIQRRTAPSLAATMSLGLTRPPKNAARATSAGSRMSSRGSCRSINSSKTRWSASTHTRDEGSVRVPRRRTSENSLSGLEDSDDFDYDSQAPVVKGLSAKPVVVNKEEQDPSLVAKEMKSPEEEASLKTLQEASMKTMPARGYRPQLPLRRRSFVGRRPSASSIDKVLSDAMRVANSIDGEELGLDEETAASIAASTWDGAQSPVPSSSSQGQHQSDSLVSLIGPNSPAASSGRTCRSGQQSTAKEQPCIGDLNHANQKARTSMTDLAMKVPQRRGSIFAMNA